MTSGRPNMHFTHNSLINPTNPITVTVIGAGGTGSQVITALARISESLHQLEHPGLQVTVIDDDVITAANMGRQLFATSEISLHKCVALINRVNRFFGTNWKAVTQKVTPSVNIENCFGQIIISCVDTVASRFVIEQLLENNADVDNHVLQPLYWMDFGNGQNSGQVILSTVANIKQPRSKKFNTVAALPFVTKEYADELKNKQEDNLPSCSLAEALRKQDLFINSTLANLGCSILWNMLREGMLSHRGVFLNLKTLQSQPISLT